MREELVGKFVDIMDSLADENVEKETYDEWSKDLTNAFFKILTTEEKKLYISMMFVKLAESIAESGVTL